jgi:signal-transduction protein with cAMP-binding, CBS, and nucleotidyltransferase domain
MNVAKVLANKGRSGVLTIRDTATLREFVRQACEHNVGALLAVDSQGVMTGILSERDVLRQLQAGKDFDQTRVADVMIRQVVSVVGSDDVNQAMDLMITKSIRHLPVLEGGKMMGFITIRDVIRSLRQAETDDIHYLIRYLQESMAKETVSL